MNWNYILAILFWGLTGLTVYLFLWDDIWGFVVGYNKKYGLILQPTLTGEPRDAVTKKTLTILFGFEGFCFVVGFLLSNHPIFGFWFIGLGLFVIYYVSTIVIQAEKDAFDNQLVDICMTYKNSLKAGMTLQQAMQIVANDFTDPAARQFKMVMREIQVGASIEEALQHLVERMPNEDLRMMVDSIEILRKTGGNMVETFEGLTETLATRKKVEGKIKTLTSQGKFQTLLLCAMPFVMAGILYVMNPEYMRPLFSTFLGWVVMSATLALVATGFFIINKIITIEV